MTQRVLATHPAVETVSEPWILLPFLYTRIRDGVYAEYGHRVAFDAIEDFCAGLPGGAGDYLAEIKELALRLYARRARPETLLFLDKTPRYHLVAAEIIRLFTEARVIFLWRNPLAVIASLIETWGKGRWNIYEFEIDLFEGLERLVAAFREAGERAFAVRFEELATGEGDAWRRLFGHLGLEFDEAQSAQFSEVELPGRMGDPTGKKVYTTLSQEPLDKWKGVLASPIRKMWCRRYVRWIGAERLRIMGYDADALIGELNSIPSRPGTVVSDIARMAFGLAVRAFEPWIMRDKFLRLRRRRRIHSHY